MDKASICIPIYNPNIRYLKRLVESIASQSYGNIEVVISDDGDSRELILELFSGINYKYLKNESDKGIFYNLNNAIANSNGEFIQILCQDDIMRPDMIEKQINTLNKYPNCGFVYTQVSSIDENDQIIRNNNERGDGYISKEKLPKYFFNYGCLPGNLSTVMVKREMFERVGLFSLDMAYGADFDFWVKLADVTSLAINYDALLLLRYHKAQASFTLPQIYTLLDLNKILTKLYDQLDLKNFSYILYANQKYGAPLLLRCFLDLFTENRSFDFFKIFKMRKPLNFILSLVFIFFNRIGILLVDDIKNSTPWRP